jgi:flagellar hook-associated protein FlgK
VGEKENASNLYTSIEDIILGARGGQSTFAHRGGEVITKLKSLTADSSFAARLEFIHALNQHTLSINRASDNIQILQGDIDKKIAGDVDNANTLLRNIAQINDEISKSTSDTSATRDLLNQRSRNLLELAEYVKFDVRTYTDGIMSLMLSTEPERLLLQGNNYSQFSYEPVPSVAATTTLSNLELNGFGMSKLNITDAVQQNAYSGSFKSSFDLRDRVLPGIQQMLDLYTQQYRDQLNSVYCESTPIDPPSQMTGIIGALGSDHAPLNTTDQICGQGIMRIGVMNTSTKDIASYLDVDLNSATSVQDLIDRINVSLSTASGVEASVTATGAFALQLNSSMYPDITNFGIVIGSVEPSDAKLCFGAAFDSATAYNPKLFFGLQKLITTGNNVPGDNDIRGIASSMAVTADILQNPNRLGTGVLTRSISPDLAAGVVVGDVSIARAMEAQLERNRFTFDRTNLYQKVTTNLDEYCRNIVDVLRLNNADSNEEFALSKEVYNALSKASFSISRVDLRQEMMNLEDALLWQSLAERMLSKIYAAKEKLYEL